MLFTFFLRRKHHLVRQEEYHCLLRHNCLFVVLVIVLFGPRALRVSAEMLNAFLLISVFSLACATQKFLSLGPPESLLFVKRSLATLFHFSRYPVA